MIASLSPVFGSHVTPIVKGGHMTNGVHLIKESHGVSGIHILEGSP